MTWTNAVIQGVFLGGFYALLACGLSLMFGLMRIVNLAHGDIAVLGAYLITVVLDHWGVSPFIGFVAVLPIMLALGYLLQRVILERSLRSGVLVPLLTTFGLAIVIQNLLLEKFSPDVRSLGGDAGWITTASWQITNQISIPAIGALALVVAIATLGGLQLYLSRTPSGRRMRATAQDPDTAELVGIDSRSVYAWGTAIAVGTAALAGMFLAMRSTFDPYAGSTQLIFAFEAVVIGGLGSLWGTLVGGIVLGVSQTIGAQIDPQYSILAGDLVFLAVLASPRGGIFRREDGVMTGTLARPPLEQALGRVHRIVHGVRRRADLRPGAPVGERDREDDDAADPRAARGDVECPRGLRRPGLDRAAGLHRPRRLRHGLALQPRDEPVPGDDRRDRSSAARSRCRSRCSSFASAAPSSRSGCGCSPRWPRSSSRSTSRSAPGREPR